MTNPAMVKRIRVRGKLTQTGLAKILHVTSQTVSNWESKRAKPDVYNGAILLRLDRLSRTSNFAEHLADLALGQTWWRHGRSGSYVRMYDLLGMLFREAR